MQQPKISLIITTYNRDRFLGQAIQSVLNQTYGNFELLIFNDGCTDHTAEVIEGYTHYDRRVICHNSEHVGRLQALIQSHELTNGELIGWLDDDDMLDATALEKCSAVFSSWDYDMVYTDLWVMGKYMDAIHQSAAHFFSLKALQRKFITKHFRLYRRSAYEEIGGLNTEFDWAFDYDLCLRIAERFGVFHLAEPLYYYRVHEGQMSHSRKDEQDLNCRIVRQQSISRTRVNQSNGGKNPNAMQYGLPLRDVSDPGLWGHDCHPQS